ncbi:MAG: hypothetical protein AAGC72_15050 [Planctomycetota bacterium]
MNATLLCPGPSLTSYIGQGIGLVVGVNRAVEAHACDVWAATDWPLICKVSPIGKPLLLTIEATQQSLKRKGRPYPHAVVRHCDVAGCTVENGKHPWMRYTSTAALQYLAWSGATHVDVWGCDWAGDKDWDGEKLNSNNRTPQRWKDERAIWNQVVSCNGISVDRHK